MKPALKTRQRGVAVITALLLTTLAVTIVASLFWQQQVQVRTMENQRLQLQTRWILRGALDWTRLILTQSGLDLAGLTTASGVWATPLAETRLDQYIERERTDGEDYNATLSGQIQDAAGRFNLNNLARNRVVQPAQLAVLQRLLGYVQLDPNLAAVVAQQVANTQVASTPALPPGGTSTVTHTSGGAVTTTTGTTGTTTGATASASGSGGSEPMPLQRVEDLLATTGFTADSIEKLRDLVVLLPEQTPLNVNTAPAEVLAALVPNMSVSEAAALVNTRQRIYYRNTADFTTALNGRVVPAGVSIDVRSNYFLVQSSVRLDRAALDTVSLLRRGDAAQSYRTTVLWIREY
ncbi:type II secretion system minor pseudopilin GspK [Oxalobacteraceae bacterium A2-2]